MSQPPQNDTLSEADNRENAGGNIAPQQLADSLGVVRHLTETYSVGGFQYTNLADAIAQARRMAKHGQAVQ